MTKQEKIDKAKKRFNDAWRSVQERTCPDAGCAIRKLEDKELDKSVKLLAKLMGSGEADALVMKKLKASARQHIELKPKARR